MGQALCSISMTRTHWVHTERVYGPPSHTAPTPTLHPTTMAFSLFIRMIMGQKPERAPCLSTVSCGDGFVAMSCVFMGAQCAATVQQRQSRTGEEKKKPDLKI